MGSIARPPFFNFFFKSTEGGGGAVIHSSTFSSQRHRASTVAYPNLNDHHPCANDAPSRPNHTFPDGTQACHELLWVLLSTGGRRRVRRNHGGRREADGSAELGCGGGRAIMAVLPWPGVLLIVGVRIQRYRRSTHRFAGGRG